MAPRVKSAASLLLLHCPHQSRSWSSLHSDQDPHRSDVEQRSESEHMARSFFERSWALYERGWRPDLLRSKRDSSWRYGVLNPPGQSHDTLLESDMATVNESITNAKFILANVVTEQALAFLAEQILEENGSVPVGEIGKTLREATNNCTLSEIIKEKFGGLKKVSV